MPSRQLSPPLINPEIVASLPPAPVVVLVPIQHQKQHHHLRHSEILRREAALYQHCSLSMRLKSILSLLYGMKCSQYVNRGPHNLSVMFYHHLDEPNEEIISDDWYKGAYLELNKMRHSLKNVDLIDGKVVNVEDGSEVVDKRIEEGIQTFKSLARNFLGAPLVQQALRKKAVDSLGSNVVIPKACFAKPSERLPMTLDKLTKVCDFLNVSAQQRKVVRFKICPQVTEHRIWSGTLEEILNGLKCEMELLNHKSFRKGAKMSNQIISICSKFLEDATVSSNPESTSWMRLMPTKKVDSSPSRQWGDLLDMVNDLTKFLEKDAGLLYHVSKLELMKEGLYQIKDVLVDRDIGYKEARHQENLVQKKLSKTLGHSSQCLFTLLQYYLCGNVRDVEVEVCGGVYGSSKKDKFCLCIGKILTSDEEKTVWRGVKQLDRALGLFKFVWESAGMKGALELQGHLWHIGMEDKTLTYRGNTFFLHGIRLGTGHNA